MLAFPGTTVSKRQRVFSVTKRMQRGCPLLCANAWLRVFQLNRDVCANSARLPLAFAATGLDLRQVWTQITYAMQVTNPLPTFMQNSWIPDRAGCVLSGYTFLPGQPNSLFRTERCLLLFATASWLPIGFESRKLIDEKRSDTVPVDTNGSLPVDEDLCLSCQSPYVLMLQRTVMASVSSQVQRLSERRNMLQTSELWAEADESFREIQVHDLHDLQIHSLKSSVIRLGEWLLTVWVQDRDGLLVATYSAVVMICHCVLDVFWQPQEHGKLEAKQDAVGRRCKAALQLLQLDDELQITYNIHEHSEWFLHILETSVDARGICARLRGLIDWGSVPEESFVTSTEPILRATVDSRASAFFFGGLLASCASDNVLTHFDQV